MSFLTCWLVIPLLGQKVAFTTLGIASGLFWVVGAMAGIYAIQNAGLALSVGIWCSLAVVTSCFFGLFVFHEHVKSLHGMYILIVGFIGMSNYGSNHAEKNVSTSKLISKCDEESTLPLDSESSGEESDESEYEYAGKDSYDSDAHAGYITRRIAPTTKLPPNKRPSTLLFNQLCLWIHAHFGVDMGHPVYIQCIQNGGRLCESIQCFTILSFSTDIHTWPKSGHAIQCWKLLFNHCHFIAWSGCWWFLYPVFDVGLGFVGDCTG